MIPTLRMTSGRKIRSANSGVAAAESCAKNKFYLDRHEVGRYSPVSRPKMNDPERLIISVAIGNEPLNRSLMDPSTKNRTIARSLLRLRLREGFQDF